MNGKVVIITGASGGLGKHLTEAFRASGATVVESARKSGIAADLTRAEDADRLAAEVMDRHGRIDALIHATGGFAGGKPIHELDDATWAGMMNLNALAAFHALRAVLPHMRKAARGRIVAIGSRAAVEPAANIAAYNASKAALVALVKTAALENRDAGITVNAILPGTIDTEANRQWGSEAERKTWVSPEQIAALALFLVSDGAAQISGAAIPIG